MLSKSDINIDQFFRLFTELGVQVAFLVPTLTNYTKSIIDATGPVRTLLKDEGVHDYEVQGQGPENKHVVPSYFVTATKLIETEASLYRPITKQGDPRIWFKDLRKYCVPGNLLALFVYEKRIYVLNLSEEANRNSISQHDFIYDLFQQMKNDDNQPVVTELLHKIKLVYERGFLPSITPGDPGVGDTLENALGISRNNSKNPDYKGIELKATRLTRHGKERHETRSTLFARVPDDGLTYHEILDTYGKWQTPRDRQEARFQLYETFSTQKVNAYGLSLALDSKTDQLDIVYQPDKEARAQKYVSSWKLATLRDALLLKHHETFWVKAESIDRDGKEYFHYVKVLYTRKPNASLLTPLIENGTITIDLAAHIDKNNKYRDHGVLFKMKPDDLGLLLGTPQEYDLATLDE